eukprot:scaffold31835_cov48-Phaeocystis_antarctica.AAC.2
MMPDSVVFFWPCPRMVVVVTPARVSSATECELRLQLEPSGRGYNDLAASGWRTDRHLDRGLAWVLTRVGRGKLEGVLDAGLQDVGAHDQVGLAGARGGDQCVCEVKRGPAEELSGSDARRAGQAHCAIEADPALGAVLGVTVKGAHRDEGHLVRLHRHLHRGGGGDHPGGGGATSGHTALDLVGGAARYCHVEEVSRQSEHVAGRGGGGAGERGRLEGVAPRGGAHLVQRPGVH